LQNLRKRDIILPVMPKTQVHPAQETFLSPVTQSGLEGRETIITMDAPLLPGDSSRRLALLPDSELTGLPESPDLVDIQSRSHSLIEALGLLAEEGKMGGLYKTTFLDSYGPERERVDISLGEERAPRVIENAGKRQKRLAAEAKIVFARAAGYITLQEAEGYLDLYRKPSTAPGTTNKLSPPKEPPFPEAVKPDIDREFRKFRKEYATPSRDGLTNAAHRKNVALHARARSQYRKQLEQQAELLSGRRAA
jgi:hypothetical protein